VAAADLNRDGKPDLVVDNDIGDYGIPLGEGYWNLPVGGK